MQLYAGQKIQCVLKTRYSMKNSNQISDKASFGRFYNRKNRLSEQFQVIFQVKIKVFHQRKN